MGTNVIGTNVTRRNVIGAIVIRPKIFAVICVRTNVVKNKKMLQRVS
jgi:hypothetical protein